MRISDWSSDVCSSDLRRRAVLGQLDRITLAPDVAFPAIDLVTEQIAGHHIREVRSRAGGGDVQRAANELFRFARVACTATALGRHLAAQAFQLRPHLRSENGRAAVRERGCQYV